MFNRKIFSYINIDYPQCLHSIYQKIHSNILVDEKFDESWNEKITNWIGLHNITRHSIVFLFVTLIVIIFVYIITVKCFKILRPISGISVPRDTNNQNDHTFPVYHHEFSPQPCEINTIMKRNTIFHFNTENYNQFYVVSLGIDETENSSLQINEIFDANDNDPSHDEMQRMIEFKTIVDEIIDRVESQFEHFQTNNPQPHDLNPESRPYKNGSRIPLLRSRQR